MAQCAQQLIDANIRIRVIAGKIEEIYLPEKDNIIISEPMGYIMNVSLKAIFMQRNGETSLDELNVVSFNNETVYMEQ